MYNGHYAPSTVSSYVSALGYSHKFIGYSDPTKVFFIIQMLKGYNKLDSRLDTRLPITRARNNGLNSIVLKMK